ncbi:hypothetical protein D3C77_480800 [compost metagenome]
MTANSSAEALSTADSPSAAASTCTMVPVPMPSAATEPARQPCEPLRSMMSRESGPGIMFNSRPDTINNARSWIPNIHSSLADETHSLWIQPVLSLPRYGNSEHRQEA